MTGELIMHCMGWEAAWYAHPGNFQIDAQIARILIRGRWMVGVWTGPHNDLLCVKPCSTNEEAERYLSPAAPTFFLACLAALWKSQRLGMFCTVLSRLSQQILANVMFPQRFTAKVQRERV